MDKYYAQNEPNWLIDEDLDIVAEEIYHIKCKDRLAVYPNPLAKQL